MERLDKHRPSPQYSNPANFLPALFRPESSRAFNRMTVYEHIKGFLCVLRSILNCAMMQKNIVKLCRTITKDRLHWRPCKRPVGSKRPVLPIMKTKAIREYLLNLRKLDGNE